MVSWWMFMAQALHSTAIITPSEQNIWFGLAAKSVVFKFFLHSSVTIKKPLFITVSLYEH